MVAVWKSAGEGSLWATSVILALTAFSCATTGETERAAGAPSSEGSAGAGGALNGDATPGPGASTDDTGTGPMDQGAGGAENTGTGGGSGDDCVGVSAVADAAVDIILVIDNSGSMEEEIERVRENIYNNFLQIIGASNLKWNLIVVSERGAPGSFVENPMCVPSPPAGADCGDSPPQFRHIRCPVASTDSLQALALTFNGFVFPFPAIPVFCTLFGYEAHKQWKDYVRFQATKIFIEVTDDASALPAADFDHWLLNTAQPTPAPGMFGNAERRKYVFNAVLGMDPQDVTQPCVPDPPPEYPHAPGLEYQKLAEMTGGLVASICQENWDEIFTEIADRVVSTLSCEYPVPPPPEGQTLDTGAVNVYFTPGGGSQELIKQDNNSGCEQGADGWQWSANGDSILLCGETCERIRNDPKGQIDIEFGCDTITEPPR